MADKKLDPDCRWSTDLPLPHSPVSFSITTTLSNNSSLVTFAVPELLAFRRWRWPQRYNHVEVHWPRGELSPPANIGWRELLRGAMEHGAKSSTRPSKSSKLLTYLVVVVHRRSHQHPAGLWLYVGGCTNGDATRVAARCARQFATAGANSVIASLKLPRKSQFTQYQTLGTT